MLSRVIAKNVGDVFLRHSVYTISIGHFAQVQYKQCCRYWQYVSQQSNAVAYPAHMLLTTQYITYKPRNVTTQLNFV